MDHFRRNRHANQHRPAAGRSPRPGGRRSRIPAQVAMTSRRLFLKSGAMAMLSLGFVPSFLARTVSAASGRRRLLVAIFQRGAVDGLNMVVPYGEAEYYRLRPSIA